jgi:DNA-binding sugar fermentation-stimulating protein
VRLLKNCHLRREGSLAEFPDCVAARSLKHLRELTAMVQAGQRAVMLFVIQRTDCDAFEACHDLDPAYAKGLTEAAAQGVGGPGLPLRNHTHLRACRRPRALAGCGVRTQGIGVARAFRRNDKRSAVG